MLRALLIYLSHAVWARSLVTKWSIAWRVASRFVAGESLQDALRAIRELNAKGMYVTLDHLGENTTTKDEAIRATGDIVKILDAIYREDLKSSVSIKLSQIGVLLDEVQCAENLAYILAHAQEYDIFVRIDMEDSPLIDQTLKMFNWMVDRGGFRNVGVVLQSYLYRSISDLEQLMEKGARVRLVKGAYSEPPEVAFPDKEDVDTNFDRMTEILLEGARVHGAPVARKDGRMPPIPAIATHDEDRLQFAMRSAEKIGLVKEAVEYQLLYGVRRELQGDLVQHGYPVRVYVPYGSEWYPYFMRRLAERPANLWFFISNLFRR